QTRGSRLRPPPSIARRLEPCERATRTYAVPEHDATGRKEDTGAPPQLHSPVRGDASAAERAARVRMRLARPGNRPPPTSSGPGLEKVTRRERASKRSRASTQRKACKPLPLAR